MQLRGALSSSELLLFLEQPLVHGQNGIFLKESTVLYLKSKEETVSFIATCSGLTSYWTIESWRHQSYMFPTSNLVYLTILHRTKDQCLALLFCCANEFCPVCDT
ncbi:uncharacterized protein FN964_000442 isoform 2-T13 [Alca torda]